MKTHFWRDSQLKRRRCLSLSIYTNLSVVVHMSCATLQTSSKWRSAPRWKSSWWQDICADDAWLTITIESQWESDSRPCTSCSQTSEEVSCRAPSVANIAASSASWPISTNYVKRKMEPGWRHMSGTPKDFTWGRVGVSSTPQDAVTNPIDPLIVWSKETVPVLWTNLTTAHSRWATRTKARFQFYWKDLIFH